MAIVAPDKLLAAEEYAELPDLGRPTELVRGRVVNMNVPYPRHGQVFRINQADDFRAGAVCERLRRLVGEV